VSLLDRGRHEVLVVQRANVLNERKQKVWQITAPAEYVRCAVQPVREWSTSEESFSDGIQMLDLRRMFTRRWPGDIHSHALYLYERYETVGAPQLQRMSRRTQHFAVTLRYIGSAARDDLEALADLAGIPHGLPVTDEGLYDAILAEARDRWKATRG
jgi:hypothetical protein